MKLILSLALALIFGANIYGQVITYDDFKTIIPFLQKEDFKGAYEKTNNLLSSTQNDSSDLRGIVVYMNIFSAAGMVSLGQMTHADFSKNTNKHIGQRIIMAGHPCIDSSILAYNSLKFVILDGQLQGTITTTNNANTSILCFEYFKYADPIQPENFIGKNVRCGGILEAIDVNPNNSKIWISRLYVTDAFARDMSQK